MYGVEAAEFVVTSLEPGTGRAWGRVAVAGLSADPEAARAYADAALDEGLPSSGVSLCLALGASPGRVPPSGSGLEGPTSEVFTREVRLDEDLLPKWLTELDLAQAKEDETTLFRIENMVPPDTWYHRWLRFAVALRCIGRTGRSEGGPSASACDVFRGLRGPNTTANLRSVYRSAASRAS